jgi:putative ABC transport system permease protein
LIGYRIPAVMLLIFGAAGMLVSAIGTYGLVAYAVLLRMREIGIRITLGATATGVVRALAGYGLRLAAIGAALGLIAALGVARFLDNGLLGVNLTHPLAFLQAIAIVMGGVTLATLLPVWRATRIDRRLVDLLR